MQRWTCSPKYKIISISHSGAYSPATAQRIAGNYEKYRYCFRLTGHVGIEIMIEAPELLKRLKEDFKFDTAYIMVADVEHCRKSGEINRISSSEVGLEGSWT